MSKMSREEHKAVKAYRGLQYVPQTRAQKDAKRAAEEDAKLSDLLDAQAEQHSRILEKVEASIKAAVKQHLNSETRSEYNSGSIRDVRRCFRPSPSLKGITSFVNSVNKDSSKLGFLSSFLNNNKDEKDLQANAKHIQLKLEADIELCDSRVKERLMIWWMLEEFFQVKPT